MKRFGSWWIIVMLVLPVGAGRSVAQETPTLAAPAGSASSRWSPSMPPNRCSCPRIRALTTTIRFPAEIGVADGQGFTEDPAKEITGGNGRLTSEYHIQWTQGDSYFTVAPLAGAGTRI